EKYLQSRYHMYRQVYFHKTVTAAEAMLMALLDRAHTLLHRGECPAVPHGSPLHRILSRDKSMSVEDYLAFDDMLMWGTITAWAGCQDSILRDLSDRLLNRRLFKSIEIANYEEHDMLVRDRIAQAESIVRAHGLDPRYYLLYGE